jgi:hypothetical protein
VLTVRIQYQDRDGSWSTPDDAGCENPANGPCEIVKNRQDKSLVAEPVATCGFRTSAPWRTWVRVKIDGSLRDPITSNNTGDC